MLRKGRQILTIFCCYNMCTEMVEQLCQEMDHSPDSRFTRTPRARAASTNQDAPSLIGRLTTLYGGSSRSGGIGKLSVH